jgi:beta-fructofuranosidase
MLTAWVGVPDIELQYEVPTEGWAHTITMLREVTVNGVGRVCQWPAAEMDGLRLAEVPFTTEAAHGASGLMGSSDYDLYTMEGAVGARFHGVADVTIEGIEGPGRLMLNGDLELVVDDREADLVFLGQAGRFRTLRRMPLTALSAGRIESLRVMVDTSVVEIFVNGGEATMTTRWFPLDIKNLAVTSTIKGDHKAWALHGYEFQNIA